jgi:pyrophosphatase PpaX
VNARRFVADAPSAAYYAIMRPALLFDLDGTLVDSIELILSSARFAFVGFDGHAPSDEEWRAGIGRPLQAVLREYAPDEAEAERLLGRYREYQLANHDRLMHAYDGIVAALQGFAAAGHPLAVVTSKADWLARRALELVGVNDLFSVLIGCDSTLKHKPDPEPVELALARLGVPAWEALFVGDSPHDVESGRAARVYTVGVTWGAFGRGEMEASGADVVIDHVADLRDVVTKFSAGRERVQTF